MWFIPKLLMRKKVLILETVLIVTELFVSLARMPLESNIHYYSIVWDEWFLQRNEQLALLLDS